MKSTHPLFHKFKSIIGYSFATVVIIAALSISGLRFILTTADLYQKEVEVFASNLLEQPVKIGSLDAKLSGMVPTLIFKDVELISKQKSFLLSRIDVGISFKSLLLKQEVVPTHLVIRGMDINITHTKKGKYKIEGIAVNKLKKTVTNGESESSIFKRWLLSQNEISIADSSIILKDERGDNLKWEFKDVNMLLRNSGIRHRLSLTTTPPKFLGGKIDLNLDLEGDISDPDSWKAKFFVDSKRINLKPLRRYIEHKDIKFNSGIAKLKLWLDIDKGEVSQLSGDIKLNDFSYKFKENKSVNIELVSAVFDSVKTKEQTWGVSVDKFNYKNNNQSWLGSSFFLAFGFDNEKIEDFFITADYMSLGALAQMVDDNNLITNKHKKILNNLNVHGDVRNFHIAWKNNSLHKLNAEFEQFSIGAWERFPEAKNISGNFRFENNSGSISILSKAATVSFPSLFRDAFKLNKLKAEVGFVKTKSGLLFNLNNLLTENKEVSAVTKGTLFLPKNKSSSHLDLQTYVSRGDASKLSHYLPVSIMSDGLVSWLDRGIVSGKLDAATVIFNGKLKDFPFNNNEGEFFVDLETSNILLNYQKGWPVIKKAKIKGSFTGQGMNLHLLTAESENNVLYDSFASITSFKHAELKLNLKAKGSAHNVSHYLVNSKILPKAKKTVKSMRLLGDVAANIKVNIPLDASLRKKKSLSYTGSALLSDAAVYMLENKLDLTNVKGEIVFNNKGVFSKKLSAKLFNKKTTLSIKTLNKGIKIFADGIINPGEMLTRFDIPGAKNITGNTRFQGNMLFPGKAVKNSNPVITLNSQLVGVQSKLPEFLSKARNSKQAAKFAAILKGDGNILYSLNFINKGTAVFETGKNTANQIYLNKGAISFSDNKAVLPNKDVLYIDGRVNSFTPAKWFEALGLNKAGKRQTFFVNPVIFNLDEIKLFTQKEPLSKHSSAVTKPGELPKFEGIFKQIYLDDIFLGRLDFETSQKKNSMHFDEIILSARNMKLVASGDWLYKKHKHKTAFDITLSSKNFGSMLTDLGFKPTLTGGEAKTIGKIYWDDAPSKFSLNRLNGAVQLDIKNGSIINIDAGAGRLLGFFSLSALPRKLLGDFKESMAKGFSFDEAKGEIIIENGDAYTDAFEINGPVADSTVSGRTGLVNRDFDNIVEVVPDVGDGVTGLVALLVNLPAGIGLWLVDKLTGEQFNEASSRRYAVTGSWDNPEYELLEDE